MQLLCSVLAHEPGHVHTHLACSEWDTHQTTTLLARLLRALDI